ncbi:MAG: hypothetical protein ACLSB9_19580 [Hydrogeniiclostridium mannosilyticum]
MSKFHLPAALTAGKRSIRFKLVPQVSGEYRCSKCGGVSNVALDSAAYIVAGAAVLAALALFAVYLAAQRPLGCGGSCWFSFPLFFFWPEHPF